MAFETVEIEIDAIVTGAFWWPIGEEWEKWARFNVTDYSARCIGGDRGERGLSLRQAVDSFIMEHSGDSSSGCEIREGVLTVTRRKGTRVRSRAFPLELFPSISDFMEGAES